MRGKQVRKVETRKSYLSLKQNAYRAKTISFRKVEGDKNENSITITSDISTMKKRITNHDQ